MSRRIVGRSLALLALCPFLATACSMGDASTAGWAGTVDTLATGTIVVRSPEQGIWDSASSWRIEEELRIGSMDGDGPDSFGDIAGIAVDGVGRIWVLDGQAQELRVFDADGRYVRTAARKGGGPGELRQAAGVFVTSDGSGIVVADYGNQRYARFDSVGRYLGGTRRPFIYRRFPLVGGVDSTGAVIEENIIYPTETTPQRAVAFRVDTAGVVTDTVDMPTYEAEMVMITNERGQPLQGLTVPFTPNLAYHVDPRGYLWHGVNDQYRLVQSSFAGDTVRVIERVATALPVTSKDVEEALEGWDEFERRGGRLDRSRIPKTRPFFDAMWTDDRGYLWVRPDAAGEQRARAFDVFDPDGRYLGRATTDFQLNHWVGPWVIGDRMYAVVRDSLDVQYVVRARIAGREGR